MLYPSKQLLILTKLNSQRTCVRLWELSGSIPGSDDFKEAQRLQAILALADGACQKIGVSGERKLNMAIPDTEIYEYR
jgi:hypothetical protein